MRPSDGTQSFWLVRRTCRADGTRFITPKLWGRVAASSGTIALVKFMHLMGSTENPAHFEAIPDGKR